MGTIGLQLILIFLLIVANGFFAASEISIVSARRGRLQQRAEAGNRGAQVALQLAAEPNRFLATVQVGISLIGTFAAAFGGDVLADPLARVLVPATGEQYADAIALTLVVVFITYLSLIIGELVPKRLGLQHAEAVASFVAPIMRRISHVASPIVWFLTVSTHLVLRMLGRSNQPEEQVTEEDVLSLVREGAEGGTFATSEQELIQRVFEFTDCTARSIMTPRTEIFAITVDASFAEVVQQVRSGGFSRIPVYRDALDHVVGIVYTKDVLQAALDRADSTGPFDWTNTIMRPPVFVLEHQRLTDVLKHFKQTRTHLALVLDEYGQTDGLVTMEDVLEELAGDIADEYDDADVRVTERADGSFLVDGLVSYADAEDLIGLPAHSEFSDLPPFDTIAGLVLAVLERIPAAGDIALWRDWSFEVVDMDGVRIDKVLVRPPHVLDERAQNEASLAIGAVLPRPIPSEQHPGSDTARNGDTHDDA